MQLSPCYIHVSEMYKQMDGSQTQTVKKKTTSYSTNTFFLHSNSKKLQVSTFNSKTPNVVIRRQRLRDFASPYSFRQRATQRRVAQLLQSKMIHIFDYRGKGISRFPVE